MDRDAIVDALLGCVTRPEAVAALKAADAWLEDHPDDLDLAAMTEAAVTVKSAWDLPLTEWPQADRDALLLETGRT